MKDIPIFVNNRVSHFLSLNLAVYWLKNELKLPVMLMEYDNVSTTGKEALYLVPIELFEELSKSNQEI